VSAEFPQGREHAPTGECFFQTSISDSVIPAQAGIQCRNPDSRLRGNDKQTLFFVLTEQ
jgi:hypothetical protein